MGLEENTKPAIFDKGKTLSRESVVVCLDRPFMFGSLCPKTPDEDFGAFGFGSLF